MSRVCLVTGVGPGTGRAIVERFSDGYQVAMIAVSRVIRSRMVSSITRIS